MWIEVSFTKPLILFWNDPGKAEWMTLVMCWCFTLAGSLWLIRSLWAAILGQSHCSVHLVICVQKSVLDLTESSPRLNKQRSYVLLPTKNLRSISERFYTYPPRILIQVDNNYIVSQETILNHDDIKIVSSIYSWKPSTKTFQYKVNLEASLKIQVAQYSHNLICQHLIASKYWYEKSSISNLLVFLNVHRTDLNVPPNRTIVWCPC